MHLKYSFPLNPSAMSKRGKLVSHGQVTSVTKVFFFNIESTYRLNWNHYPDLWYLTCFEYYVFLSYSCKPPVIEWPFIDLKVVRTSSTLVKRFCLLLDSTYKISARGFVTIKMYKINDHLRKGLAPTVNVAHNFFCNLLLIHWLIYSLHTRLRTHHSQTIPQVLPFS